MKYHNYPALTPTDIIGQQTINNDLHVIDYTREMAKNVFEILW